MFLDPLPPSNSYNNIKPRPGHHQHPSRPYDELHFLGNNDINHRWTLRPPYTFLGSLNPLYRPPPHRHHHHHHQHLRPPLHGNNFANPFNYLNPFSRKDSKDANSKEEVTDDTLNESSDPSVDFQRRQSRAIISVSASPSDAI